MAPRALAARAASRNSGRLVMRIATRSPGRTPRSASPAAASWTRWFSSAQVIDSPWKRSATWSGMEYACRATWSTQWAPLYGGRVGGIALLGRACAVITGPILTYRRIAVTAEAIGQFPRRRRWRHVLAITARAVPLLLGTAILAAQLTRRETAGLPPAGAGAALYVAGALAAAWGAAGGFPRRPGGV